MDTCTALPLVEAWVSGMVAATALVEVMSSMVLSRFFSDIKCETSFSWMLGKELLSAFLNWLSWYDQLQ